MKIKVKIVKKSDNSVSEVEMTPKQYKDYFKQKYSKVKNKRTKKKKSFKNPIWKKPYIESKKMDIELMKRINAEK